MALLFCDGFDHYSSADIGRHYDCFATGPGVWTINTSIKRTGAASLRCEDGDTEYMSKMLEKDINTAIYGFGLYFSSISDHFGFQLIHRDGYQATITIANDGTVQVRRGGSTGTILGSSSAGTIVTGEWQHFEAKIYCHDSAGTYEVRVNEVAVVSGESADTQNLSHNDISAFRFGGSDTGNYCYIDDFYICDDSGSHNNDFLGDRQIDTLYPTGAGNYTQMLPSGETNNWECVADTDWSDNNNEVESSGELIDTYTFSGLTELVADDINAVQVTQMCDRKFGGTAQMSHVYRLSSVDYSGEFHYVRDWTEPEMTIFERNPSGEGQWTYSQVEGGEFGIKQGTE